MTTTDKWTAIILAGSRGPSDPIAQQYGLMHKCLLPIDGEAMLKRVVHAVSQCHSIDGVYVSIESDSVLQEALGLGHLTVRVQPEHSAPASALATAKKIGRFPILITTGDHALLRPEIVHHVCKHSTELESDVTVGLATRDVIDVEYPQTKRTYFRFSDAAVSGCNLFTVHNAKGLRLLEVWSELERNRKSPWKLAFAFGLTTLVRFVSGRLSLEQAFETISRKCDTRARPLLLPFAEAAIDVDKPADKDLAEQIIAKCKMGRWTAEQ